MRLTSQRIFTIHPELNPGAPLPERLQQLLADQQRSWRQLSEGYRALRDVGTRELPCDGFTVRLQFNPRRIVSTGARVDEQSIKARPCFLCVENLPDEQRGILYHGTFLILCNPAPIFERHFTVSHTNHTGQAIEPAVETLLDLSRDLGPGYTVFYNGPRCGASAPDHLHFQACPSNVLPIELEAVEPSRRVSVRKEGTVSAFTLSRCGRSVIVVESRDAKETAHVLRKLLESMRTRLGIVEEPMVNILCTFGYDAWRLIIFPRKKHRPDAYFLEGNDRILISPAAVDLGGLVVTPVEKDFMSVDAKTMEGIYTEVSLEPDTVGEILDASGR